MDLALAAQVMLPARATAFRLRWEPILDRWISPAQSGFLPGRSMLNNVVEIEHGAMVASLEHDSSALVLFDFSAAFPSVAHAFLLAVPRHIGFSKFGNKCGRGVLRQ